MKLVKYDWNYNIENIFTVCILLHNMIYSVQYDSLMMLKPENTNVETTGFPQS